MKGHGTQFGRKKDEAIAALLTQRTTEDAARAVGVANSTIVLWMKDSDFQIAYREARRAAFSQAIARLQQASSTAVTVLLKVMIDPSKPASARVRAADSVLDHASKAIEIEDVEVGVAALEQAAEISKQGR